MRWKRPEANRHRISLSQPRSSGDIFFILKRPDESAFHLTFNLYIYLTSDAAADDFLHQDLVYLSSLKFRQTIVIVRRNTFKYLNKQAMEQKSEINVEYFNYNS